MKKYGVKVETFSVAGRFQHKVYDIGPLGPNREGEVTNDVVKALKDANEKLWEEMPEGASPIVSVMTYKVPKKVK
jgi:hypothetical protein